MSGLGFVAQLEEMFFYKERCKKRSIDKLILAAAWRRTQAVDRSACNLREFQMRWHGAGVEILAAEIDGVGTEKMKRVGPQNLAVSAQSAIRFGLQFLD